MNARIGDTVHKVGFITLGDSAQEVVWIETYCGIKMPVVLCDIECNEPLGCELCSVRFIRSMEEIKWEG